jgi:5-methyltetrahydrofolate--homocysteine methyltransferase
MPQLRQGETTYDEAPSVFEEFVPRLYRAGARIIGGCCGTTPDHIRAMSRAVDKVIS